MRRARVPSGHRTPALAAPGHRAAPAPADADPTGPDHLGDLRQQGQPVLAVRAGTHYDQLTPANAVSKARTEPRNQPTLL